MKTIYQGGFLVSKVKQISARIFDKKLKDYGIHDLNNAQGRIIFILWQNDHIPITELVKQTALGKTTLSSMLERLETSGHIIRTISKEDKRKTIVSLTEKSRQLKEKYNYVSSEMLDLYYEGIPEKDIIQFEETLKIILNNLTQYEMAASAAKEEDK